MDPLATLGELENHLQRPLDPAQGAQALQLASGAVRAFCKWDLSLETTTLVAEATGWMVLTLPTLNLVDVTEVRVDGTAVDMTPTVLSWSRRGQLFRPGDYWPRWSQVEVDCTHGYSPIPDLLKLVTLDLGARIIANPEQLISASTGRVSRTWSGGDGPALSPLHERLLHRYSL